MPPKGSRSLKTMSKANKKYDIRRNPKRLRLGNYNFTRYASATIGTGNTMILPAGAAELGFTFIFALNQLRNFTDFTNLFDMYQINKVDLYFKLVNNPDAATNTALAETRFPVMWYHRDFDDGSAATTVANMQERQGAKRIVMKPDVIHKISVVPKFQKMVYQTLTSTGYGPGSGFLDCVDNTVPHYALKTVLQVNNAGADWYVETQAKYHVSFKGPQ